MIIFIDVDDVVADLISAWLARYNKDWNDSLASDMITEWEISKFVKPECGDRIYEYLEDPALYDTVQPIAPSTAKAALYRLRLLGHRIVFATTSVNGSAGRKLRWLYDYGFLEKSRIQKDYIEVSDKGLLYGDILIDDGYHNITTFKGFPILFDRFHNRHERWSPRIYSLMNLFDGGLVGRFQNQR